MKISNGKKELARIISENDGWRDGAESSAQCAGGEISFWSDTATKRPGEDWRGSYLGACDDIEFTGVKLPNWHQTILSRAEYFHLYPAPDSDGWIEHDGKHEPAISASGITILCKWSDGLEQSHEANMIDWIDDSDVRVIAYRLHKPNLAETEYCWSITRSIPEPEVKPSIEQLAADYRNAKDYAKRKQEEADDARADAEAMLKALELAGEELGLVLSVATKPVFTGKFNSAKHGDNPSSLDAICDGCGKRFGTHVGFYCRP